MIRVSSQNKYIFVENDLLFALIQLSPAIYVRK